MALHMDWWSIFWAYDIRDVVRAVKLSTKHCILLLMGGLLFLHVLLRYSFLKYLFKTSQEVHCEAFLRSDPSLCGFLVDHHLCLRTSAASTSSDPSPTILHFPHFQLEHIYGDVERLLESNYQCPQRAIPRMRFTHLHSSYGSPRKTKRSFVTFQDTQAYCIQHLLDMKFQGWPCDDDDKE